MLIRQELKIIALIGCGILFAGFACLGIIQDWNRAAQWLLLSGLLWCFSIQQTWVRLDLNRHDAGSEVYKSFGWANRVTLLRGGLIALTGGFLFQSQSSGLIGWIPGLLYTIAAILDRLDGFIARRTKQTSLLGNELDTVFDALGLLIVPLLAVSYGKIHWSYLLVSVAYYVFQWGLSLRRRRALPIHPLMPSMLRRALAGFQMGLIAVVLWPPFQAPLTLFIGAGFMIPMLIGFAVDWLVATGSIKSQAPHTITFFTNLSAFSTTIFQPALRLFLSIVLFLIIIGKFDTSLFAANSNAESGTILTYCVMLFAAMVMFGLAGRIAALALIILLAWHYSSNHFDIIIGAVIFSAVWILLLGSGRFSLWRREDIWINRHDGA